MSVAMRLSYKQDIKDPLVTQAPVTLLMQGDNQANVIELTLMDGATPASLSGYTATVYLKRADGVQVRCPGTVSGNVATVPLQAECYSVPGQYAAIMKLSGPNELRTVLRLAGYVESDGQGAIIDPSGSIPSYEDLERIVQELEEALQQAETAISGANAAAQNATTAAGAANTAAGAANTAAGNANEATSQANAAAESIEGLTISESVVEYGAGVEASVTRDPDSGALHVAIQTERGPQGPGYTIKGVAYGTVAELEASVPSPAVGDQYNVGAAAPYNVYRWTGAGWEDQGKIQGPPGKDGLPGEPGVDGEDAAAPRMLSFSLPASGWAGSGPYTCAISEASATANTAVVECVLTAATRANQLANIDWVTSAGSIALSTTVKPTGELAGYMILTEVQ